MILNFLFTLVFPYRILPESSFYPIHIPFLLSYSSAFPTSPACRKYKWTYKVIETAL